MFSSSMFPSGPPISLLKVAGEPLLSSLDTQCYRVLRIGSFTCPISALVRMSIDETVVKTCDSARRDIGPWSTVKQGGTKPELFELLRKIMTIESERFDPEQPWQGKMDGAYYIAECNDEDSYLTMTLETSDHLHEVFEEFGL